MPEPDEIHITFNAPEAHGELIVERGGFGPSFVLPHLSRIKAWADITHPAGRPSVGFLDMFYLSRDPARELRTYVQFVFFDPEQEEPLVKVVFFNDGRVRVALHKDARQIEDVDRVGIHHGQALWGFEPATLYENGTFHPNREA